MSSLIIVCIHIDSGFKLSFLGSFSITKLTEGSVVTLSASVSRT